MIRATARYFVHPGYQPGYLGRFEYPNWNEGRAIVPGDVVMLTYHPEPIFVQILQISRQIGGPGALVIIRYVDVDVPVRFGDIETFSHKWIRSMTPLETEKYLSQFK